MLPELTLTAWCYHDLLLFLPSLTLLCLPTLSHHHYSSLNENLMPLTASLQEERTGCSSARMWVAVDQDKRRSGLRANLGHRITCTVMAGSDTKGMKCVHPLSPEGRPGKATVKGEGVSRCTDWARMLRSRTQEYKSCNNGIISRRSRPEF